MIRGRLGGLLGGVALVVGVLTAALSTRNRARGDELDRLERWCETQERRNELQRVENRRAEWRLLTNTERLTDTERAQELEELAP
jgi:hypothetical protein